MTNQSNKSFILHKDSLSILDQLDDEQAGKLFKAIYQYQKNGEIGDVDQLIKIALNPFINQFERDRQKYDAIVDRNRKNISKRWNTKNTTGKTGIPKDTKNTDNDSKSDSKNKSDSKKESKKKSFTKPTLQDIQDYCSERNKGVNADKFFNYYEANGWKVGKNSMKDWKAAVRTWENNNKETTNQFNIDKWNKY